MAWECLGYSAGSETQESSGPTRENRERRFVCAALRQFGANAKPFGNPVKVLT